MKIADDVLCLYRQHSLDLDRRAETRVLESTTHDKPTQECKR